MKALIISVLLLLTSLSFSQNRTGRSRQTPIQDYYKSFHENEISDKVDLEKVIGSPYEKEDFILGEIVDLITKESVQGLKFRYNVYQNFIEILSPDDVDKEKINALVQSENIYVKLGNKEYHYKDYINKDLERKSGYLIKYRSNSGINVYKEIVKKFYEPKIAQTSYHKDDPGRFVDIENYYLEINGQVKEVKMNKNKIVDYFPDNQKSLKNYIKKEKLSFKDQKDLVLLVSYYSRL